MTEAEWLQCDDFGAMLTFLGERISRRKGILYVCGGLRQIWDRWLYAEASRNAVEVAELTAEGRATPEEIDRVAFPAEKVSFGYDFDPDYVRDRVADGLLHPDIQRLIAHGVFREHETEFRIRCMKGGQYIQQSDWASSNDDSDTSSGVNVRHHRRSYRYVHPLGNPAEREQFTNAARVAASIVRWGFHGLTPGFLGPLKGQWDWPGGWLLRCIFGNPFRPVAFAPSWRSETAITLAAGIYEERAFDRLPILADALEEAGCDHPTC